MKARAIAIAGPTASGKTGLALAIAAHLKPRGGAEIISVDSALVYKEFEIDAMNIKEQIRNYLLNK